MPRTTFLLAAFVLAAPATFATTFVVDDDGGPGVDFTDVQPAIDAAVPGDTILVRPGVYSGFALGEGLAIVGTNAVLLGSIEVASLPPGRRATLSGLGAQSIEITSCSSPVIVDNVWLATSDPFGAVAQVSGSSDVRFRECVIGNSDGGPVVANAGLSVWGSRVEVTASMLQGSHAGSGDSCESGHAGGFGLAIGSGASVHLSSSTVRGGNGGESGLPCFTLPGDGGSEGTFPLGGNGGSGIWVASGGSLLVTGVASDLVRGGNAGLSTKDPAFNGLAGNGLVVDPGGFARISGPTFHGGLDARGAEAQPIVALGTLEQPAPADPSLVTTGSPTPGGTVTLVLRGEPGSLAQLRLGRAPAVVDVPGSFEDRLLAPLRTFALGTIPPSGEVELSIGLSSLALRGSLVMAQGTVIGATSELTQSVPLVVR